MQLAFPGLPEPIGPPTKRCPHCLERKALGRFSMDLSRPNGLCRICRDCDGVRYRERWRQNAERMRARQRQRYAANIAENRKRGAQRRRSEPGKAINRLAVKRYGARNQEKRAAHAAVRRAVLAGILERPDRCELAHVGGCSGRIEMHHDDYDRPLDVRALCTEHHNATHHKPRHFVAAATLFEMATTGDIQCP